MRAGDWKLLEYFEDNHVELYNLRDDPSESRDRAKQQPRRAEQLRARLHDWWKESDAQLPTKNPDYSPDKPDTTR